MIRQGNSLHIMGSKVAPDVPMDVNATNALQHLKQELADCQSDNKRLSEQINCLIALIKRSVFTYLYVTLENMFEFFPPSFENQLQNLSR